MNISQNFIKILIRLRNEEHIKGGELKAVLKLLEPMLREGGLKRTQLTKVRFEVSLTNIEYFNLYISSKFNIEDLDGYLRTFQNSNTTRAEMLTVSRNDKAKIVNPFDGMYIASYDDIEIYIDSQKTRLSNVSGGIMFIGSSCKLKISENILVVGVENAENIIFIKKQLAYFSHIKQDKIFVYRNASMLNWLENIENDYLHYGDFDFAGISIYKSQILPRVKANKMFFIPSNIEEMLKKGQSDLYYKHYFYKANIVGIDDKLDELIVLIEDYKKTVRQEFLIAHTKEDTVRNK